MGIGNKMKKVRELRNYSQEYVAEKLGISQVSYSRVESGTTKLDFKRFQAIAQVLEVDVTLLLKFDEKFIFNNCNQCDNEVHPDGLFSRHERQEYLDRILVLETEIDQLKKRVCSINCA